MTELAERSWPDVGACAPDEAILVIPLGATEQHGPHLPLSTDTEIARALGGALARDRTDVVLAPAVPYGSSGEHDGFPGTLSIGQEAVELLLVELCRSAGRAFRRVLALSAHGGNAESVQRAVTRLRSERRDVRAWSPRWPDAHAGRAETSIMLAIAPTLVRAARIVPGNAAPIAELLPRLRSGGVREVSPSGILGDPTGASAQEGRALLAAAVADAARFIDGWTGEPPT